MNHIFNKAIIENNDGTCQIRFGIIAEEGIPFIIEKDCTWITLKDDIYLIPTTIKGLEIINNTYNFIEDLLYYERELSDFIHEKIKTGIIPHNSINHFYNIIDTYKELDIVRDKNILLFNAIENYTIKNKMDIFYLSGIEILLRLLNQDIDLDDIKRLSNNTNYTPIIFPIKNTIYINLDNDRDYNRFERKFYTGSINLADLISTGHLQLNNNRK